MMCDCSISLMNFCFADFHSLSELQKGQQRATSVYFASTDRWSGQIST